MSQPQPAQPAKLVIGLFANDKQQLVQVCSQLQDSYGPVDLVSPWFDFAFTDYYREEMGTPLFRRMLAFRDLIAQEQLAPIKLKTNSIEKSLSISGRRSINIDPGFLLYERFVLATAKNYTHRIYIGQGIYADLTLIYQKGAYQPLPWTYPDYASSQMGGFLLQVRRKYAVDLKTTLKQHLIS